MTVYSVPVPIPTESPAASSHAAEKHHYSCHLQTLQLFSRCRKATISLPLTNPTVVPTQQKNIDFLATYKLHSWSHATRTHSFSCYLQTLQLFPRSRKTLIFLPLTSPTIVPTQQNNINFPATYKPYSCSHAAEKHRFPCQLQRRVLQPPRDACSAD